MSTNHFRRLDSNAASSASSAASASRSLPAWSLPWVCSSPCWCPPSVCVCPCPFCWCVPSSVCAGVSLLPGSLSPRLIRCLRRPTGRSGFRRGCYSQRWSPCRLRTVFEYRHAVFTSGDDRAPDCSVVSHRLAGTRWLWRHTSSVGHTFRHTRCGSGDGSTHAPQDAAGLPIAVFPCLGQSTPAFNTR